MRFLFAVSIIIASRSDPPGWMIAVTPARAATSIPSGNGKYASEAITARRAFSPAFRTAVLAHELAADERVPGHREDLEVPAIAQNGQRFVLVARRDDRLVKGPLHGLGELASDDSVRADDAAECRHRVAHERAAVRLGDLVVRRDPARVLMLDDPNGRLRKIRGDAPGRVDVEHVVEARRLPVQLLHRGHRAVLAAERVERGVLVRVLAVAQVADLAER